MSLLIIGLVLVNNRRHYLKYKEQQISSFMEFFLIVKWNTKIVLFTQQIKQLALKRINIAPLRSWFSNKLNCGTPSVLQVSRILIHWYYTPI